MTDKDIQKAVTIFAWAAIIIVCIMMISWVYKKEHRIRTQMYNAYINLHGEDLDEEAKEYIRHAEELPNRTAIEEYQLGTVYLLNANDVNRAHQHFTQALNAVINRNLNQADAIYILDRIDDYRDYFMEHTEIPDLPYQQAMFAFYEQTAERSKQIAERKKEHISEDDPAFVQKTILANTQWNSDSQNVHDSAITKMIAKQLEILQEENSKFVEDLEKHNFDELQTFYRSYYQHDASKLLVLDQVLSRISENNFIYGLANTREKAIILAVWQRTFDPRNKDRAVDMRTALGEAILDCKEAHTVVCLSGRQPKIMQALAQLDCNPEMGVFKTKAALRNEFFTKAAKIVDNYIGVNGSASDELKSDYANSVKSEQVEDLIEQIKKEIEELAEEYKEFLPAEQVEIIKAESLLCV
jgi:hypothetical protein